jgi:hypothetical protein
MDKKSPGDEASVWITEMLLYNVLKAVSGGF